MIKSPTAQPDKAHKGTKIINIFITPPKKSPAFKVRGARPFG
jgi:hypothetical protein